MNERRVTVTVSDIPNARKFVFDLDENASVKLVKDHICQLTGASPSYINLTRNGRAVTDKQLLHQLDNSSFLSRLPLLSHAFSKQQSDKNDYNFSLDYSLDGGCVSEGFICCSCCGLTSVCRPFECIHRCLCFFMGCDISDCNAVQCFCWRCYFCATNDQRIRSIS